MVTNQVCVMCGCWTACSVQHTVTLMVRRPAACCWRSVATLYLCGTCSGSTCVLRKLPVFARITCSPDHLSRYGFACMKVKEGHSNRLLIVCLSCACRQLKKLTISAACSALKEALFSSSNVEAAGWLEGVQPPAGRLLAA